MSRLKLALAAALGATLALAPAPAPAQSGKLEAAYVVIGGEGAVARAILSGTGECPSIDLDGATERMGLRASPDSGADAAFPVLVCEHPIPARIRTAAVGGRRLPLPKSSPARIAAFGDTGCRLKAPDRPSEHDEHHPLGRFQDCNSPSKWPFARLSRTAAARKPDLVIHVGDYIYRESPCPATQQGCRGSPYGDNWPTWQADFFQPAAALLAAAPWIMVRGNHETCARAGRGYFRFLHPALARDQAPLDCIDVAAPYAAEVGGKSFIVMDSSNAYDSCGSAACDSAPYAAQFANLKPKPGAWLLTHRPIWAAGRDFTLNQTLQQALAGSGGRLPDGIALTLSGHMHVLELLSFADARPPQLVVGTGGTSLDRPIDRKLAGLSIGGAKVSYGRTERRFGLIMFTPAQDGSTATFIDAGGAPRFRCALTKVGARCD